MNSCCAGGSCKKIVRKSRIQKSDPNIFSGEFNKNGRCVWNHFFWKTDQRLIPFSNLRCSRSAWRCCAKQIWRSNENGLVLRSKFGRKMSKTGNFGERGFPPRWAALQAPLPISSQGPEQFCLRVGKMEACLGKKGCGNYLTWKKIIDFLLNRPPRRFCGTLTREKRYPTQTIVRLCWRPVRFNTALGLCLIVLGFFFV